jgi:hypothetical protein
MQLARVLQCHLLYNSHSDVRAATDVIAGSEFRGSGVLSCMVTCPTFCMLHSSPLHAVLEPVPSSLKHTAMKPKEAFIGAGGR